MGGVFKKRGDTKLQQHMFHRKWKVHFYPNMWFNKFADEMEKVGNVLHLNKFQYLG